MLINVLLIIIAIPIVILPFYNLMNKNETVWYKKLTKEGIIFYILIGFVAVLQVVKEVQSSKNEIDEVTIRNEMKGDIDSLKNIAFFSSDTIGDLRDSIARITQIIGSVGDRSTSIENKVDALTERGKASENLDLKLIESDRPILTLYSAMITSDEMVTDKHIDFTFSNVGKRPITNVIGRIYGMKDTVTVNLGTIPVSRSDNFASAKGFTIHQRLLLNPDSTPLDKPIYYYFSITYNDFVFDTSYKYEIASKLPPFKKGEYLPKLSMCPEWEVNRIKKWIKYNTHN